MMARPILIIQIPIPCEGKIYYAHNDDEVVGLTMVKEISKQLPDYHVIVIVDNTICDLKFTVASELNSSKEDLQKIQNIIDEAKRNILFEFIFDHGTEQWFWTKCENGKKEMSKSGFDEKQDCINDAIINGYENK